MKKADRIYNERLMQYKDEIDWLYMEMYDDRAALDALYEGMHQYYEERKAALKKLDEQREADPEWFKSQKMLGMMLYIENFAGNIKGVQKKLPYLASCNVNLIHLMPFLDSPEGRSDGGYAVADFRKVREDLGTMEDLSKLSTACHKRGMNLCMDFVMNHTSEDHEWAKRARSGEKEYMDRYFFYDSWDIPSQFEQTVPQVFPTTAPGNFTYLPEIGHHVMTSFYPYQWDLNYGNPVVFNEMMYNFLYLANQGMDVIRIDAVPYIWKELWTQCRNLPKVHTIVRLMNMIGQIVCPGVVLLGEVVMEPEKVVPYFGTVEKPECHMLYNVTTMATTWHALAAQDVRLLQMQMDKVNALPSVYTFLNYLRCHDDIGWGLDFSTLRNWGMEEVSHKRFLNDFYQGKVYDSVSRGELYNDDPVTQDARFCGTTASMCGIEAALEQLSRYKENQVLSVAHGDTLNGDLASMPDEDEKVSTTAEKMERFEHEKQAIHMLETAIRKDLMLHAYMLIQSGIPMIYSGDEIGQLNDYSYKENPAKAEDSRYVHRGAFKWDLEKMKDQEGTAAHSIFHELKTLEDFRAQAPVFGRASKAATFETGDNGVLGIRRLSGNEELIGLFNFSGREITISMEDKGWFSNVTTGTRIDQKHIHLLPYGYVWAAKKINKKKEASL